MLEEGTDTRFCKQCEIFKNTSNGVFVAAHRYLIQKIDLIRALAGYLSPDLLIVQ